jgi:P pilus assembly chaperone PapD
MNRGLMISRRLMAAAKTCSAILIVLLTGRAAGAQSLSVLPVNILLQPGQRATTLTVTNQGNRETAIQVRAYAWSQPDGDDQLTTSDSVVVSPPLASIAPGATQVVRLILRLPPSSADREATYRILVDQIPPAAEPGIVHVVLTPVYSNLCSADNSCAFDCAVSPRARRRAAVSRWHQRWPSP